MVYTLAAQVHLSSVDSRVLNRVSRFVDVQQFLNLPVSQLCPLCNADNNTIFSVDLL